MKLIEKLIERLCLSRLIIRLFTAMLAVSLVSSSVFATSNYGQASDIFNVGAGARSMAMGSAFTAVSDDASAPYFNPAGLAHLDEHQLMAMHAPLLLNTNYNYLASAHPFGDKWGSIALSDVLLTSDKFEVRDQNNVKTSGNGELKNNAILASYARKLPWSTLSTGVTAKMIQQKIVGFSDSTMGLDVGFLYEPMPLMKIGATFANINSPEVKLANAADVFRPVTKIGLSSMVFKQRLLLAADMIKPQQQGTQYAAGLEYNMNKMFSMRAGFNPNRSYTFGIGVKVKPFSIDYAFSDTDVGAFNKFSFTWAWHNIYKTDLVPPTKEGRAVYPLEGFDNKVVFLSNVPSHVVQNWNLEIRNKDGKAVRTLKGDLRPPEQIVWDARNQVGEPVIDGRYTYTFNVQYKNGKSWKVPGQLQLALPVRKMEEAIHMDLELNGAQGTEDASNETK